MAHSNKPHGKVDPTGLIKALVWVVIVFMSVMVWHHWPQSQTSKPVVSKPIK